MIQVLVEQERIAEEGKARDADGAGRKDVRLLRDKVLCAVILSHWKAGDICPYRRKRIRCRSSAEHVAEIQRVGTGKIMIHAQSKLVVILAQGLRGDETIGSNVRQREKRQDIPRCRVDGGQLVVRDWNRSRAD